MVRWERKRGVKYIDSNWSLNIVIKWWVHKKSYPIKSPNGTYHLSNLDSYGAALCVDLYLAHMVVGVTHAVSQDKHAEKFQDFYILIILLQILDLLAVSALVIILDAWLAIIMNIFMLNCSKKTFLQGKCGCRISKNSLPPTTINKCIDRRCEKPPLSTRTHLQCS